MLFAKTSLTFILEFAKIQWSFTGSNNKIQPWFGICIERSILNCSTAEQFIGQELLTLTPPYMDSKLYYWTREERNANAEIDYVFQWNNSLVPVEVKAGKTGSLKSLHVYLLEKRLNAAIRFNLDRPSIGTFRTKTSTGKIQGEIEFQLLSLPLYMCFHLPEIINAQGLTG